MKVRPLTRELAARAKKELNEKPERIEADLQHLKDWIAKQPHLKARTEDQWLVGFLRGCKYSLEKTKSKIDLYYTMRTLVPEIVNFDVSSPKFLEVFDTGFYLPLPKTDGPDGPRIVLMRPGCYNPEKIKVEDTMSVVCAVTHMLIFEDDHVNVSGLKIILDLDNVTMGHFLQMTPALMKKMVVIGQDASPFRQKGNHYLNTPTGFETIYNFIKPLLHEKNQQRLYVHNKDMKAFHKMVPQKILPKEYGGEAGTVDELKAYWRQKLLDRADWFEEERQFGTDESKRIGPAKTTDSMFGVEGSFRQLSLD